MVYCSNCGTNNPDNAVNCSNCGAPLYRAEARPYNHYEYRHQHREDQHGGGIWLLIAGMFIVLLGLGALFGWSIWNYVWPIILILIGAWVITLGLRRNRRYRQA